MHSEEKDPIEVKQENEENLNDTQTEANSAEEPAAEATSNEDPTELLRRERDEWKDKYVRLYAEFDNYKRRTLKEKAEWFRDAKADVISAILPVLDDFDRAIAANANDDDLNSVKEGFELIHNKLYRMLEGKGLKPMDSMSQAFDTDLHEAITNIPAPSEDLKGKVVDVIEKGYSLDEHIIRYAKVVVGQ